MELHEINFHYYPARIETRKALGVIDLPYFLNAIRKPSDRIKKVFRLISIAEDYGNMKRKATLKQNNLFYFTPCVFMDGEGRGYKNIVSFNGLAVLDFDHIENAAQFKKYIFENHKFIIAAFLSPSKKGVKFIVRIPVVNSVEDFKSYYFGLGILFDKYKGWDGSGQNCVLPLFLSTDQDILIREDAELFDSRGKKNDFFSAEMVNISDIKIEEGDKGRILENIRKAIDAISSNGHPQLIAATISLGGYVGANYLTMQEAESFIFSLIESSSYLKKGIAGYKKTASTALQKGTQKPIKL